MGRENIYVEKQHDEKDQDSDSTLANACIEYRQGALRHRRSLSQSRMKELYKKKVERDRVKIVEQKNLYLEQMAKIKDALRKPYAFGAERQEK